MLLRIGKGPKRFNDFRDKKANGELVWISADGIYVVTKNGRIIRTKGLINDLLRIEYGDLNLKNPPNGHFRENSTSRECITLLINLG